MHWVGVSTERAVKRDQKVNSFSRTGKRVIQFRAKASRTTRECINVTGLRNKVDLIGKDKLLSLSPSSFVIDNVDPFFSHLAQRASRLVLATFNLSCSAPFAVRIRTLSYHIYFCLRNFNMIMKGFSCHISVSERKRDAQRQTKNKAGKKCEIFCIEVELRIWRKWKTLFVNKSERQRKKTIRVPFISRTWNQLNCLFSWKPAHVS